MACRVTEQDKTMPSSQAQGAPPSSLCPVLPALRKVLGTVSPEGLLAELLQRWA